MDQFFKIFQNFGLKQSIKVVFLLFMHIWTKNIKIRSQMTSFQRKLWQKKYFRGTWSTQADYVKIQKFKHFLDQNSKIWKHSDLHFLVLQALENFIFAKNSDNPKIELKNFSQKLTRNNGPVLRPKIFFRKFTMDQKIKMFFRTSY